MEMFDWAERGAPTYAISLVKLLATLDQPGEEIYSATRARCAKAAEIPRQSPRGFTELTCDVIFAKWGERDSLSRLEARLYDDDTIQDRIDADQAARYLSIDLAAEGLPLLRQALSSTDLEAARRVAAYVCNAAGPDDGVVARIEGLVAEFPDDERLPRILDRCRGGS